MPGDTVRVEEFGEGGFDFVLCQDEDFGHCDGVEPALDPAPDSGKERRGANDLVRGQTCYGLTFGECIQIFDPVSLGSGRWRVHLLPACALSDSRIASSQLLIYPQCSFPG